MAESRQRGDQGESTVGTVSEADLRALTGPSGDTASRTGTRRCRRSREYVRPLHALSVWARGVPPRGGCSRWPRWEGADHGDAECHVDCQSIRRLGADARRGRGPSPGTRRASDGLPTGLPCLTPRQPGSTRVIARWACGPPGCSSSWDAMVELPVWHRANDHALKVKERPGSARTASSAQRAWASGSPGAA
jgi:hypothetical protein